MTNNAPPVQTIVGWTKALSATAFTRTSATDRLTMGTVTDGATPGAINDEFTWSVVLGAGTYKFVQVGTTFSDKGIGDVQLDGVSIGTLDWYSAGSVVNVTKSITGITVSTTAVYTLKIKMSSKNGSSSGYHLGMSTVSLARTDDPTVNLAGLGFTLPYRVDIIPMAQGYYATVGTPVITQASGELGGGRITTAGASGDSISWMVLLAAGTWTVTTIHRTGTDRGIATVSIGGSTAGTYDGYAAVAADNVVTAITGITVANDGIYELKYLSNTKNGSSSSYFVSPQHIILQRTGA